MNRGQYIGRMKAQLDRWNAQAEVWQAKARAQRRRAAGKLAELSTASVEAWRDVAAGADQAWRELRKSFSRARHQFGPPQRKDGA